MACDNCSCGADAKAACTSGAGASARLPPRAKKAAAEHTSIWSTSTAAAGEESAPLISKASTPGHAATALADDEAPVTCEARCGGRNQCCRDLKAEDRHLLNPDIVRDIIIGLSDGLTVPFALTAGLSGIGSSRIVVVAGMAELVSGAISMGVGGLLSAQAELQHYRFQSRATSERVRRSCSGEMEREVIEILGPYGVPAELASQVAARLQRVEADECGSPVGELPPPAAASVRSDGLTGPSRGLTPFILRLGEHLEEVEDARVWQSALVIGASYFIGGFIPLLPYIFLPAVHVALIWSIVITGIILLLFGVAKQQFTGGASDARGLAWGAVSTLLVGASAAAASFGIVRALEG